MNSDDPSIIIAKLLLVGGLLAVSAIFASAEVALLGVGKVRLLRRAKSGDSNAGRVLHLFSNTPRLIATILIGITIANYISEALVTSVALDLSHSVRLFGFSVVISLVFAFFVLTFIDVVPILYGTVYAEKVSLSVAKWVYLLQRWVLFPLVFLTDALVSGVLRLLGMKEVKHPPLVNESEILSVLSEAEKQGILTREQRQMLISALEFKEIRVGEVKVPRVDMVSIPHDTPLDEAMRMMRKTGHSRLPVYRDSRDDIIGILYAKDVLSAWYRGERGKTASELAKPPIFAAETQKIYNLLRTMQRQRRGMAIVLDEDGGTAGIITVEDLLEEIVGEIYDEYDVAENPIHQVSKSEFLVRAPLSIRQVEKLLGIELPEEKYDTITELMIAHLERLPQLGDRVELDGIVLEVSEMRGRRMTWVKVKVPSIDGEDS